jgi:hypothetical protein
VATKKKKRSPRLQELARKVKEAEARAVRTKSPEAGRQFLEALGQALAQVASETIAEFRAKEKKTKRGRKQ